MTSDQDGTVELRQRVPRRVLDVLDAISLARRQDRWELVTEVLQAFTDQQEREALAVFRVLRLEEVDTSLPAGQSAGTPRRSAGAARP